MTSPSDAIRNSALHNPNLKTNQPERRPGARFPFQNLFVLNQDGEKNSETLPDHSTMVSINHGVASRRENRLLSHEISVESGTRRAFHPESPWRCSQQPARGVNRLYVAADVRIDFGTLIRACSRTILLPPIGQGGTGRCCMASRVRSELRSFFHQRRRPRRQQACGTRQGVLGAPGGHWVAGIALARWLQLVVAAPRNLSANVSMVSSNIRVLDLLPLNCRFN